MDTNQHYTDSDARSARIEALIQDWEDTAEVNKTGVGRAYAICARDLRAALEQDG